MSKIDIIPFNNELPSSYSDRVGKNYVDQQTVEHKKTYAQFFTPQSVAKFLAKLVSKEKSTIKIADLGSGSGILGISICEVLAKRGNKPQKIELTAYEIDNNIIPYLEECLKYTKKWLQIQNIAFTYTIKNQDFILENATALEENNLFSETGQHDIYDVIISNPPYFKLNKSDPRAVATLRVIHGQPNIYALFMAISAHLLNEGGELIYITPRSYTAGHYFKLFREHFFSIVDPTVIHLFGSRDKAFNKDDVLQENIILKATKKSQQDSEVQKNVLISYSKGLADLDSPQVRSIPLEEVLDMNTKNKVVRIPLSKSDDKIIRLIHSWKGNLFSYGLKISTGPVVPFRARDFIADSHRDDDHIPLLWMQNIKPMATTWPAHTHKQQFIEDTSDSRNLLIKNSNYVLLRRFSAKEEKQRLVAAPYLASAIQSNLIGLENHVNYIYRPQGELTMEEVYGLAALYNCKLLDTYFRTYNGNTQVSASEISAMPLPELDIIKIIGSNMLKNNLHKQELDDMVTSVLSNNNQNYLYE